MNKEKAIVTTLAGSDLLAAPFYIVAPPLVQCSEALIYLYDLCRFFNAVGEKAFIIHYPVKAQPIRNLPHYVLFQQLAETPDNLFAPLATQDILDFYDNKKIQPVVIYDGSLDNPLKAKFFGRCYVSSNGDAKNAAKLPAAFILSDNLSVAESLAQAAGSVSVALEVPLCRHGDFCRMEAENIRERLRAVANKLKKMAAAADYLGGIVYPYQSRMILFEKTSDLLSRKEISFEPRKGDGGLNNAELPYVVLPSSVIGDIAREVMFEQQRWSWRYKIKDYLSKFLEYVFSFLKR